MLNGGAIIPVPEATEEGSAQRTSSAAIWGEVARDPKPFVQNTKKRGQLLKIVLLIRLGKESFQLVHVPSDSPWYYTVRALKQNDRVCVFGVYAENDGFTKDEDGNKVPKIDPKTGEQVVYRSFYPGFIMPELAVTAPDKWRKQLLEAPDPINEAVELEREKAQRAEEQNDEGWEYTNQAFNPFGGGGW